MEGVLVLITKTVNVRNQEMVNQAKDKLELVN